MFRITTQHTSTTPQVFTFNGGEVQVMISSLRGTKVAVRADLRSSDDIMTLLLLKDAIDREYHVRKAFKTLIIPYLPYARQDRACEEGEALSVKVMANLINSMNFDHVITWDAHSDVGPALINNCTNISQEELLDQFANTKWGPDLTDCVLVSPDGGAIKKILKVAQYFDGLPVIFADKVRDTKTGQIKKTQVPINDNWTGSNLMIVDDICDGGMTFIKLAEQLKKLNPANISLYVTHGIFSKGYQPLFDAGIDQIYTTNSFDQIHEVPGLKVLNL